MCHHQFTESLDGQHQMDERGKILINNVLQFTAYCVVHVHGPVADHFATINKWLIVKEGNGKRDQACICMISLPETIFQFPESFIYASYTVVQLLYLTWAVFTLSERSIASKGYKYILFISITSSNDSNFFAFVSAITQCDRIMKYLP